MDGKTDRRTPDKNQSETQKLSFQLKWANKIIIVLQCNFTCTQDVDITFLFWFLWNAS